MTPQFNEFHKHVPVHLTSQCGTAATAKAVRRSPNLSRRELRRLIADMVD